MVDVDLARLFDRVNRDTLAGRLEKRIEEKRVPGLIRSHLEAGVVVERHEGGAPGGPVSPLLADVLLDEVDKELERRGHALVRHADDSDVYVQSRRAGGRVPAGPRKLCAGLQLRVDEDESGVDYATRRELLGSGSWVAGGEIVELRVAGKALGRMKDGIRGITRRNGGRRSSRVAGELKGCLRGWKELIEQADTPDVSSGLGERVRHKLRCLQLKRWKRGKAEDRELRARGMTEHAAAAVAACSRRWWASSAPAIHIVLPNRCFDGLGAPRLAP